MNTIKSPAATTIVTSAWDGNVSAWQVIDREPIQHDVERDLSALTLSADDLGCVPGATFLVELRDDEDQVFDAVQVAAF